jgi:hypothetical protein
VLNAAVSCGTWVAFCALSTGEVRTQDVTAKGSCNVDG